MKRLFQIRPLRQADTAGGVQNRHHENLPPTNSKFSAHLNWMRRNAGRHGLSGGPARTEIIIGSAGFPPPVISAPSGQGGVCSPRSPILPVNFASECLQHFVGYCVDPFPVVQKMSPFAGLKPSESDSGNVGSFLQVCGRGQAND